MVAAVYHAAAFLALAVAYGIGVAEVGRPHGVASADLGASARDEGEQAPGVRDSLEQVLAAVLEAEP